MVVQTRIAAYLHDKGISCSHVAKKTGISRYRLSYIVNNHTELRADEFEKICIALEVNPSEFIQFPVKN